MRYLLRAINAGSVPAQLRRVTMRYLLRVINAGSVPAQLRRVTAWLNASCSSGQVRELTRMPISNLKITENISSTISYHEHSNLKLILTESTQQLFYRLCSYFCDYLYLIIKCTEEDWWAPCGVGKPLKSVGGRGTLAGKPLI